jgi:hypothetical protein
LPECEHREIWSQEERVCCFMTTSV